MSTDSAVIQLYARPPPFVAQITTSCYFCLFSWQTRIIVHTTTFFLQSHIWPWTWLSVEALITFEQARYPATHPLQMCNVHFWGKLWGSPFSSFHLSPMWHSCSHLHFFSPLFHFLFPTLFPHPFHCLLLLFITFSLSYTDTHVRTQAHKHTHSSFLNKLANLPWQRLISQRSSLLCLLSG